MSEELVFYPPSRRKMFWQALFLFSLGAAFAVAAILLPSKDLEWWLAPALAVFLVAIGSNSLLYVLNWRPWLTLDRQGFTCRASWHRALRLDWNQIHDLRIRESQARGVIGYKAVRFSVRFISVYPNENRSILRQYSIFSRLVALLVVRMGYTPLSISQQMLDQPLDDVLVVMNQLRAQAAHNPALQSDVLGSLSRA